MRSSSKHLLGGRAGLDQQSGAGAGSDHWCHHCFHHRCCRQQCWVQRLAPWRGEEAAQEGRVLRYQLHEQVLYLHYCRSHWQLQGFLAWQ